MIQLLLAPGGFICPSRSSRQNAPGYVAPQSHVSLLQRHSDSAIINLPAFSSVLHFIPSCASYPSHLHLFYLLRIQSLCPFPSHLDLSPLLGLVSRLSVPFVFLFRACSLCYPRALFAGLGGRGSILIFDQPLTWTHRNCAQFELSVLGIPRTRELCDCFISRRRN